NLEGLLRRWQCFNGQAVAASISTIWTTAPCSSPNANLVWGAMKRMLPSQWHAACQSSFKLEERPEKMTCFYVTGQSDSSARAHPQPDCSGVLTSPVMLSTTKCNGLVRTS